MQKRSIRHSREFGTGPVPKNVREAASLSTMHEARSYTLDLPYMIYIALVPLHFAKQPSNLIRQQQLWRTNTHDEAATKDRRSRSQNLDQTLKQTCSQEYPESAACVQDPIDSLNSAIRNAHRTSLRPSSTFEPRHPSLKGVIGIKTRGARPSRKTEMKNERKK